MAKKTSLITDILQQACETLNPHSDQICSQEKFSQWNLQLRLRLDSARAEEKWELAETVQTLTNLVQVAECSIGDPGSIDQAVEIMEFIDGQMPVLVEASVPATEWLVEIRQLAHELWGEALELFGQGNAESFESLSGFAEASTIDNGSEPAENASQQIDLVLALLHGTSDVAEPAEISSSSSGKSGQTETSFNNKSPVPGERPQPPTQWTVPDELGNCQNLCEAFLDDAHRCLGEMESVALESGSAATDQDRSRAFCRQLHTMKGAAASVGLEVLASYLHEVEEWLDHSVTNGKQSIKNEMLLAAVDSVRQQIAVLEVRNEAEPQSGTPAQATADLTLPKSVPAASRPSSGSSGDQSIRVRAQQLDRLMDMLAELVAMRNRREVCGSDMKRLGDELGRCSNRLRRLGEESFSVPRANRSRTAQSNQPTVLQLNAEPTGKSSLDEVATDISTITRELNEKFRPLADENAALTQFIRHFRQELMQLQRLPVSGLFQRLKRAIYDAARLENKQVEIRLEGEDTGLEQSMQERLFEPLLHMVRNSVSHGIETPDLRTANRKSATGTVTLTAHASASMLTIVVADDGRGLDYDALRRTGFERGLLTPGINATKRQLAKLIFHPGFSTRETASQVSGRGVGMDVVATTIDRLQGRIEVDSQPNNGTSIRISIPLTTGIEHVMVYRAGGQLFALPMRSIEAANRTSDRQVKMVNFARSIGSRDGSAATTGCESLLLDPEVGILVDEIVGPDEAVVRPLPELLRRHPLVSGVVLSAQGEMVLLLNAERTREWCWRHASLPNEQSAEMTAESAEIHNQDDTGQPRLRALIVDDSLSARMSMKRKLVQRGFDVAEAGDGQAALACIRTNQFDLVITDLDMPRMNGFDLLGEITRGNFREMTTVVSSSRAKADVWQRIQEQGAAGYLPKPVSSFALDEILRSIGCHA